ncbi:MAG: adenine phosphoribosyltransferase [Thermomicrobiales bacterium]|nr:adenine phosphoribosyltransferase [Thermomicrobiales bacterium]
MVAADVETVEARLRSLIHSVPDFPEYGVVFRDITPLLADADAFRLAVETMAAVAPDAEAVVGIESRGFIFAAPVAFALGAGFVPVRKLGRLPRPTEREAYDLEYGANTVEMHIDAIRPGQRVLLVDDVLATGGTMRAAARLVERLGGAVVGIAVLVELAGLHGRDLLEGYPTTSIVTY